MFSHKACTKQLIPTSPAHRHLSHQLEIGNSRPIARFTFSLMKTEEQLKKYEKITCNFKIVSDDSPLMEFSKYGAIAPFVGMYKAMVLERFDWNETKTISSTSSILCQKSIGVVNLLSSVLANGALEMKCQVEIITLQTKNDPGVKTMKHSRTSVDKLAKDIGELLNDDEFPDLRIVVQGKEIKVHKLIICARSPVFRAMLSLDMKEKRESRINLTDVSYEAAKEFMKFLYSAELCTANYAKELLILAEMYQITDLKETCEHNLLAQLNKDNALDCLYTANLYNCKFELKKRSFKVIAKYVKSHYILNSFNILSWQ